MNEMNFVQTLQGLTNDQQQAIRKLQDNQQSRLFVGATIDQTIIDFKCINILREVDQDRANNAEAALFKLCGYDPSNT